MKRSKEALPEKGPRLKSSPQMVLTTTVMTKTSNCKIPQQSPLHRPNTAENTRETLHFDTSANSLTRESTSATHVEEDFRLG